MPGISPKMLTKQLRELEEDGLVLRVMYPEIPAKVEFPHIIRKDRDSGSGLPLPVGKRIPGSELCPEMSFSCLNKCMVVSMGRFSLLSTFPVSSLFLLFSFSPFLPFSFFPENFHSGDAQAI